MAADPTTRHDAAVRTAAVLSPFVVFAAFPLPIPALPAISADLEVGVGELQLLVSGYALGLGAVLMVAGVLADRLGPAKVWIASMIGFAAFSVVCAVATDTTWLVGGRIGEGLAGAGLMAGSLTLVATALSPRLRATAMAFWGAAIGAGLTVGPLAGGIALEFGQWRPIFLALAVLAAAAAVLGAFVLPKPATGRSGRIDLVGTVTLAGGVGVLILSISWVGAGNWTAPRVLIGLAVAAALLAGFAVSQRRSADPMINTWVLRHGDFLGGLVTGLALALSVLSMMVVIGPYLQVVLG
ncbi:MAG: MFS transporter, partial [Actinomycetes bacterium]